MKQNKFGTINVRAPVRFDFGGGPTDVPPFSLKEKGIVVNCAIQQFAYVKIQRRKDKRVLIQSHDFNQREELSDIQDISIDGKLKLIKACLLYIQPKHGLEIETRVEVPPGSGLGSSAALSIALLAGLRADLGVQVPNCNQLVQDALHIENNILKNINGGQDQYASALGGFHRFIFGNKSVILDNFDVPNKTRLELEERSVLCYSGSSHVSGKTLDQVMASYSSHNITTVNSLRKIRDLAIKIEKILKEGDLDQFGSLIQSVYDNQTKLHSSILTHNIEKIVSMSRVFGSIGAKIAGAGGGGCVYLFCEPFKKQYIINNLLKHNFTIIPFNLSKEGVTVWFS